MYGNGICPFPFISKLLDAKTVGLVETSPFSLGPLQIAKTIALRRKLLCACPGRASLRSLRPREN
jgi:hypothetical protein